MRLIALAVSIAMLGGATGYPHARSDVEGWREISWPFPRDGWPAGRAFSCAVDACGEAIEIYVRPKIGFCNCDSGVADDDEVDRVGDLDLMSQRFVPKQAGRVVRLADMSGRARNYELTMSDGTQHAATGIALSHRCDLLVAVVKTEGAGSDLQRLALEFLSSDDMHHWMMTALGNR